MNNLQALFSELVETHVCSPGVLRRNLVHGLSNRRSLLNPRIFLYLHHRQLGAAAPRRTRMSHILHGFTDPKYLDALIGKAETQLREAENNEDRQRFAAYLEVLKVWKDKLAASRDVCGPEVPK
ncbi:MAG: hypothetical protein GXY42_09520 [Desulfovibrionales bacterium]|nr:hypothetical protein [Desulfovibrionales bacterium]